MKYSITVSVFFVVLATNANAAWEEEMDLLSAGAAASVVAMHSCKGVMYSDNANLYAATKLKQAANEMPNPVEAYNYANSAFETKVNALWQSTQGVCANSQRLIDMARSTGFLAPKSY